MSDTASFLNSKDIADYWRSIGFICTPLQSAYIVWQNHTKTLQEKHAAWREIVETMPDCIVAEGHRKTNMGISDALAESLHAFLQAFMQLQNQLIERFYRNGDHAVYRYRVLYDGDKDWSEDRWLYDTAEECFEDVYADEDLIPSIVCIQLTKQWIGENRALSLISGFVINAYSFAALGYPTRSSFWISLFLTFFKCLVFRIASCSNFVDI